MRPQRLKFVRTSFGTSGKGNPYDMTEVSDGLATFTLSNAQGIRKEIEALQLAVGDEFEACIHVSTAYGSLRGTIVAVGEAH